MSGAYHAAIGIDVSDRKSQVCVMARAEGNPKVVSDFAY